MTGIDLLVSTFLMACLSGPAIPTEFQGEPYSYQEYDCPLSAPGKEFVVWRHLCGAGEIHGVAFWNKTDHTGWVLNRFGETAPAFVHVEVLLPHHPLCMTEATR